MPGSLSPNQSAQTALSPYRVLDLTEGGCLICGKILGDLGADVIQVEMPAGNPSRNIGPFYHNVPDPENSLFWLAYSANKRGVTLNIEANEGKLIFERLVKKADFVIESFAPGYLAGLGLGYDGLSRFNQRVILTSITPFGQTGPRSKWSGCDLTEWASGGMLYVNGDPDRAPVDLSFPQASLHAGAEAAVASLVAHQHRLKTGIGQHVDVSAQQAVVWTTMNVTTMFDFGAKVYKRSSSDWTVASTGVKIPWIFPCKDGHVCYTVRGGGAAFHVASTRAMVKWMDEEGKAPAWLKDFDWVRDYDISKLTQAQVEKTQEPFRKFLLSKTKADLFRNALKRGILLAPVNSMKDVCEDEQLASRGYWQKVKNQKFKQAITHCGPSIRLSETPMTIRRPAPGIGEHNREVYVGELGMSEAELAALRGTGVV